MKFNDDIKVINKNNEFKRIYARGSFYVSPLVVVYVWKVRNKNIRFGITASKKVGNAVKRNRARRLIACSLRELLPLMKRGYSLVFVARAKTPSAKSYDVKREIVRQLKRANVLEK